ncbi:hypothetical protein HKBW3S43_00839 [Candidatus Hakubella thermalkaliphila]|uniref:Uncharacterized protein n=2 Tax=Candidatus Hakubella thermalkaliphila TaxID=2754717 RepID=A0A6V8PRZ1_9ACTN|nr:hypothetical protein [Candidatus Hakubella thermalkaliphila]MBT9170453.1 hypothetical protein [Actinomycetota bacterium]GFP21818.1 hypothetical protein HKBW3S06_01045 [Candidatus Hakubella thermalkaliphila]GFP35047.1 hypothetical protein HKBW3S43_00839 [Candidatus Hakubella thermalkaliphila]
MLHRLIKLIGAVLVEIDEAWSSGSRYVDMADYWEWKANTEKQYKEVSNTDTHVRAA